MKNYYDIAIIGGGIGGLMTAWHLTERDPALSVCIIEKGHSIEKRTCPIVAKKVDKCIKCPSCAIMEGAGRRRGLLGRQICHLHRVRRLADRLFKAGNGHRLHRAGRPDSGLVRRDDRAFFAGQ